MDLLQRFKKERDNQKAEIPELPPVVESIKPESKQEIQKLKHTRTEADIQEPEASEITSTDIPEMPPAPIAAASTVPVSRNASVYSEPSPSITLESLKHGGDISKRLYEYLQNCPEEWIDYLLNGLNNGKFQLTRATEAARRVAQKDLRGAKLILVSGVKTQRKRPEVSDKVITSVDIPETPPIVVAVPTIQQFDSRERELDALINQLRPLNRHWQIETAREKKVPMKALLHAATLWLSDDTDDWSAAMNTIFQFTSPYGNKQLCYPSSEKVAIPELSIKR
jgi:hypothetical protein